jgi:hypothetical protein
MTPSTLCIARSSLNRPIRSDLTQVCLHVCRRACFCGLPWLVLSCQSGGIVTFSLENDGAPPNSPQKPTSRRMPRPPAEPARVARDGRRHAACRRSTSTACASRQAARRSSARVWMRLAA